jgi:UDP-N-acetylmuramoylalanine--D-glutamate ligase
MDFNNKKVCIIGFGKSGQAAAERLLAEGAIVKVSDVGRDRPVQGQYPGIQFEFGGHTSEFVCDSDLIVVSPGVHLDIEPLIQAKEKNTPIISEIELAFGFFSKPVIAVTGTNGKTTTTTLIGEMLKNAGYRVGVGGNIGYPLVSVDDSKLDYIVAEISSYQLEAIEKFKPHIALILNLTEDHLERYGTMEPYGNAKARIFEKQTKEDYLIYNEDDKLVKEIVKSASSNLVPFSVKTPVEHGVFVNGGYIVKLERPVIKMICPVNDIKIKGAHNIENALAASAAALIAGVKRADIEKTLREFPGVEHRIEYVDTINGVEFINDSKGTNPDSTIVALRTVGENKSVILILGGRDKGTDLAALCGMITDSAKKVILIGEAAERFKAALESCDYRDMVDASSLDDAVRKAFSVASSGDKVLLSPACASFDMFNDFEQRGKMFKQIVGELKNEA